MLESIPEVTAEAENRPDTAEAGHGASSAEAPAEAPLSIDAPAVDTLPDAAEAPPAQVQISQHPFSALNTLHFGRAASGATLPGPCCRRRTAGCADEAIPMTGLLLCRRPCRGARRASQARAPQRQTPWQTPAATQPAASRAPLAA